MSAPDLSRAQWRTSTFSSGNGACVEVALNLPRVIAVRDSKNPDGETLILTPEAFGALTASIRAGALNLA
jgi:hypothetical protein